MGRTIDEDRVEHILHLMGVEPNYGSIQHFRVLAEAMYVYQERNAKYGDLWKRFGWMGNAMHIASKAARITRVFWKQKGEPAREVVSLKADGDVLRERSSYDYDDAIDLINYCAFFVLNLQDGNELGDL